MRARQSWTVAGLVGFAAAGVVLLWPLSGGGVSGNAITPRYHEFGWFSYAPLPDNPSREDLRRAGATVPDDPVPERRVAAAVLTGLGGIGLAAGNLFRKKSP